MSCQFNNCHKSATLRCRECGNEYCEAHAPIHYCLPIINKIQIQSPLDGNRKGYEPYNNRRTNSQDQNNNSLYLESGSIENEQQIDKEYEQPGKKLKVFYSPESLQIESCIEQVEVDSEKNVNFISFEKSGATIESTINVFELRLGIATWNVAHFGIDKTGKVNIQELIKKYTERKLRTQKSIKLIQNSFKGKQYTVVIRETRQEKKTKEVSPENIIRAYNRRIAHKDRVLSKMGKMLGIDIPEISFNDRIEALEDNWMNLKEENRHLQEYFRKYHDSYSKLKSEYHKQLIIAEIIKLFEFNKWLDIMILQEVNQGIERLKKELEQHGLNCYSGPEMMSASGKNSQHEYYPIILRKESSIKYLDWVAIDTSGNEITKSPISWNKKNRNYRPIVVHHLKVNDKYDVRIGVVHTTPGGGCEFEREEEYFQISKTLEKYGKEDYWIIGGDYYLFEESRVVNPPSLDVLKKKFKALLEEDTSFSLWLKNKKNVTDVNKIKDEDKCDYLIGYMRPKDEQGKDVPFKDNFNQEVKKIYDELKKDEVFNHWEVDNKEMLDDEYDSDKYSTQWMYNCLLEYWDENGILPSLKKPLVDVASKDIVRNMLKLAFKHQLPPHFKLAQTVSGTNWHGNCLLEDIPEIVAKRENYYATARIADFFIYSQQGNFGWAKNRVGLMRPEGGVCIADTRDLKYSKYWGIASDHFPVGGMFSINPADEMVDKIIFQNPQEELTMLNNTEEFQHDRIINKLERLFDKAVVMNTKVAIQIKKYCSTLNEKIKLLTLELSSPDDVNKLQEILNQIKDAISQFEDMLELPTAERMEIGLEDIRAGDLERDCAFVKQPISSNKLDSTTTG